MSSINRNQPEKNREDLAGEKAIQRIKDFVGKAETCFFCTAVPTGDSSGVRPMNVRKVDDDGNLWFLSADDSSQNKELAMDSSIKLFFQGSPHSDLLYLKGQAEVTRDKAKIKELWEPIFKTWFTEGSDDRRITVIKVAPSEGYYWDNKHGSAVAGVKMLFGAMIGKTLDDSIEGKISV